MTNRRKILKSFAKGLLVIVISFSVAFCSVIVLAAGPEPLDLAQNNPQVSTSRYNREAVVEYAQKHYRLANTEDYYNFGNLPSRLKYSISYLVRAGNGDCANFTSQCMYAGGIAQNDDWYHYVYYNEPIKLKLFSDKSIVLGYRNEAGKYTLNSVRYNFSASWLRASSQYNYFSDEQNGYINGEVITVKSAEQVTLAARGGVQKGDLLFWSQNGEAIAHVTVVSDVTESDIFYTGHSQIGFNRSLGRTVGEYGAVKIVRLKDSF